MYSKKDWFTDWFDTKYYHILYQHRDEHEAEIFIRNLATLLKLPKNSHILDLACGKGRHAIFLNKLGYRVTGADISMNSIEHANQYKNERLHFIIQDMRLPFNLKTEAIFNLFTSFGYFADEGDDLNVLQNIKNSLKTNGVAVIDYLNVTKTAKNLVPKEIITLDHIKFHISREIKNDFIIKKIEFTINQKQHCYYERVKYLNRSQFEDYFKKVGLKIKSCFGDYHLNTFNQQSSDRLIFILEK